MKETTESLEYSSAIDEDTAKRREELSGKDVALRKE